jgi:capsular exopolysaccharide synthesis family protein
MKFWHIYRLLYARRWLLLLLMLTAAALIFLATLFQASRSETFTEAKLGLQQEAPTTPNAIQDRNSAIDDLVGKMSSNAAVIAEAARLLKLPEDKRSLEVKRILEQNGQFATWDMEAPALVAQRIASGDIAPAQREIEIGKLRRETRLSNMNLLAKAADKGGAFAAAGLTDAPSDIQKRIREELKVEAISSLDTSDNNPRFSNFVRVTGKFPREAEANLYVNMYCLAFMDWYRKSNNNSSNQRIQALTDQLTELKRKLKDARREEAVLKRNPDVGGPDGQIQNATLATEQKVNTLREKYNAALASLKTLSEELPRVSPTITVPLPINEKPNLQAIEAELIKAEAEYQRLEASSNEGPNALIASPAEAQKKVVDSLRAALARARKSPNTKTEVNPSYQLLQQRVSAAREGASGAQAELAEAQLSLKDLKQRQAALPGVTGALDDIREELKRLSASITATTQQIEAARSAQISASKAGTLSLISQAVPLPSEDSWSRRAKLILFGSLLALLVGITAVVVMDAVDNRISDTRDVEEVLELPIAGVIPAQIPDPRRAPRITYLDPLSPVSEAYRLLRTDILFTQVDHPFQSLLGVGAKPGQGTTTTVSNLAITLAQSGKRVILVDADLRRPRLHETFGVPIDRGLTSLLLAQCTLEDVLQPTEIDNLMVLPAGPSTTQPSELLGSREMRELHETLKQAADFVLFDSPSAITFADAAILASFLDATVIVIRANEVPRKAEQDVRALLDRAKANIIGVVLNAMPADRVDSAHYHGQYYPTSKKNTLQLPGKGDKKPQPPSLPGGGGSSDHSSDIWAEEDELVVEPLRPAARTQEPPTPSEEAEVATAEDVSLAEALPQSRPQEADESDDEEDSNPPPFDYSKPYVSRRLAAEAKISAPEISEESPSPVLASATPEDSPETIEPVEGAALPDYLTEAESVVENWREDVEKVRQSLSTGEATLMPGMASTPKKRGLLGGLLGRQRGKA